MEISILVRWRKCEFRAANEMTGVKNSSTLISFFFPNVSCNLIISYSLLLLLLLYSSSQHSDRKIRNRKLTEYMMSMQFDPKWISESEKNQKELQNRIEIALNTNRPQNIIGQQTLAISEVDTRKVLNRIGKNLEVLIVHGEKDRVSSPSTVLTETTTLLTFSILAFPNLVSLRWSLTENQNTFPSSFHTL